MKRKIKKYFSGFGRKKYMEIDPDEIFLDSSNLPEFDTHQFEGRIEKSISKTSLITLALLFAIIGIVYVSRVWVLQVREGEAYTTKSEKNRLRNTLVFAERGIIYDRNNKELAWNVLGEDTNFSFRKSHRVSKHICKTHKAALQCKFCKKALQVLPRSGNFNKLL